MPRSASSFAGRSITLKNEMPKLLLSRSRTNIELFLHSMLILVKTRTFFFRELTISANAAIFSHLWTLANGVREIINSLLCTCGKNSITYALRRRLIVEKRLIIRRRTILNICLLCCSTETENVNLLS